MSLVKAEMTISHLLVTFYRMYLGRVPKTCKHYHEAVSFFKFSFLCLILKADDSYFI